MIKYQTQFLRIMCIASVLAISGCATNIEHIPTTAVQAPINMVYNAGFERVWSATQAALSAEATFKVLDKNSAIMVTEYKTVEAKELSIVGTVFLGKTYKSNYTVNFRAVGPTKTDVTLNVGLQAQQVGFFSREEDQPQVKSFLRQKLFEQIGAKLR